MNNQIYYILNDMSEHLSISQMKKLQISLIERLEGVQEHLECCNNVTYLSKFVAAKRVEGCSERTIHYYDKSVTKMFSTIKLPVRCICQVNSIHLFN